jgi:pimeloyl-ACP methyl ester carboxylesterase
MIPRNGRSVLSLFVMVVVGLASAGSEIDGLFAGEVRMRSGMVITGAPRKLQSLSVNVGPNSEATAYPVLMMQTGAARYFLASKQIAEGGLNLDSGLAKQESFRLSQQRTHPKAMTLASIGQFSDISPFDDHGRRTVTLNTSKGTMNVVQGITEVSPETVKLMGINFVWDYGISTKSIPPETLVKILRHRIDPQNPQLRLQLARFYIQAEMFPQAFDELEAIARDFPDLKDRALSVHEGLVQEFGRVILRELKLRVEAGQHKLAEEFARQITLDRIGGAVQKETQEFLKQCDRQREAMIHVRELLDELTAKLSETPAREKLPPLRSVLLDELHPDTLGRLAPFLKAEADAGYTVSEKLALAYSGWVVGAANAVTDLDQAIRLWDARFLAKEALRAKSPNERQLVYQQLRRVEGVGAEAVQQLIPQLPPAVETPGIEPGQPFRIDVEPDDQSLGCSYSVLLPIEYSPQHTYPLVVTLRAEGQSLERMLEWWGGTAELPGLAQRRGYIVIAPEYATPEQGEYAYDSATHFRVLAALNDARRRFPIDSERIYLSGHGMGADAAFDLGFSHPDEFAGVIPICGVCDHYARQYVKNGLGSAWYVVGGELDRDLVARNSGIFDVIMKNYGFKIDFLYAEFVQRGFENYAEELPRIFEWMALHRRLPLPKEMEMRSLRATDRRFFWVVDSPSKHYTLWIHPDLVDLEKRVIVKVKTQQKHNAFIDPDVAAMLEDYRERGDRQRLFVAKLEI